MVSLFIVIQTSFTFTSTMEKASKIAFEKRKKEEERINNINKKEKR